MSQRIEFIQLAKSKGCSFRELCRRYGISTKTGYKWLNRYKGMGEEGLRDKSRRPLSSPVKTPVSVEEEIIRLRKKHPAWGARKLKARLERLGVKDLPSPSTITAILRRHDLVSPESSKKAGLCTRFEHERPNDLWQMDFKGDFKTQEGSCFPLTILDDHSRYSLVIEACYNQRRKTVQDHLVSAFERYGMPNKILADNGGPWGATKKHDRHTKLAVWLLRMGVDLIHGRPYHPQTQGKEERFHRSLKAEVLAGNRFWTGLKQCQQAFDHWRNIYNFERPHEALGMDVPGSRYYASERQMPKRVPPVEYSESVYAVRKVRKWGVIGLWNATWYVGGGFAGEEVGVYPTSTDGVYDVYFMWKRLGQINRREKSPDKNRPISIFEQKNH